jgi:hypothetical protein
MPHYRSLAKTITNTAPSQLLVRSDHPTVRYSLNIIVQVLTVPGYGTITDERAQMGYPE